MFPSFAERIKSTPQDVPMTSDARSRDEISADALVAFGVLDTSKDVTDRAIGARARSLTVSSLRWGYFGDIIENTSVDGILSTALATGSRYCFIQSHGHTIVERSGVNGTRSSNFFETLREWLATTDFFVAGAVVHGRDGKQGLLSRCLLVDLDCYRRIGCPVFGAATTKFAGGVDVIQPVLVFDTVDGGAAPPGAAFLSAAHAHGLAVRELDPGIAGYLVDFGSDLSREPALLDALQRQSDQGTCGVFVLNFESYADIEAPPDRFRPPLSALYSVAAGLKPNRLLQTHGFDARSHVVYFDYSEQALEFRRLLLDDWDGRDYPSFLRRLFRHLPPSTTHYFLWPGATPEDLDWQVMERLWQGELDRWGGEDAVHDHWSRYRSLPHRFLRCNVLTAWRALLDCIEPGSGGAIWWSNVFCTTHSAWHYTLEQKQMIYEDWIRALAAKAPDILVYGSDHANSAVNGFSAADYCERYLGDGGSPLRARKFHRYQIRF